MKVTGYVVQLRMVYDVYYKTVKRGSFDSLFEADDFIKALEGESVKLGKKPSSDCWERRLPNVVIGKKPKKV